MKPWYRWATVMSLSLWCGVVIAAPYWFESRSAVTETEELVGFGQAASRDEAVLNAKREIAQHLGEEIRSEVTSSVRVAGQEVDRSGSVLMSATASVRLDEVRLVREERADEIWFVAVAWSTLAVEDKLQRKTIKAGLQVCPNDVGVHPLLATSPLLARLSARFGCAPDVALSFRDGAAYLRLASVSQLVQPADIQALFSNLEGKFVTVSVTLESPRDGDVYRVQTNVMQPGYLSVLIVDSNGDVATIMRNEQIDRPGLQVYPPAAGQHEGIQAVLPAGLTSAVDWVVALRCDKSVDLSRVPSMSDQIAGPGVVRLDEVLRMAATPENRCDSAARVVLVLPRS